MSTGNIASPKTVEDAMERADAYSLVESDLTTKGIFDDQIKTVFEKEKSDIRRQVAQAIQARTDPASNVPLAVSHGTDLYAVTKDGSDVSILTVMDGADIPLAGGAQNGGSEGGGQTPNPAPMPAPTPQPSPNPGQTGEVPTPPTSPTQPPIEPTPIPAPTPSPEVPSPTTPPVPDSGSGQTGETPSPTPIPGQTGDGSTPATG